MARADTNWTADATEHRYRVGELRDDGHVDDTRLGGPVTLGLWEGEEDRATLDLYKAADPVPIPLRVDTIPVPVAVPQRVVPIEDTATGVRYEVAVDYDEQGDPFVTSCFAYATRPGQRVESIPTKRLAQYAARHIAQEDEEDRPIFRLGRNDDESTRRPTDEEFADAYKALRRKGRGPGDRTLREELAERYGVTEWAIDKRIRRCRDLRLLVDTNIGRPRTSPKKPRPKRDADDS